MSASVSASVIIHQNRALNLYHLMTPFEKDKIEVESRTLTHTKQQFPFSLLCWVLLIYYWANVHLNICYTWFCLKAECNRQSIETQKSFSGHHHYLGHSQNPGDMICDCMSWLQLWQFAFIHTSISEVFQIPKKLPCRTHNSIEYPLPPFQFSTELFFNVHKLHCKHISMQHMQLNQ